MAAVDSENVTPSPSIEHVESFNEVFTPKDTLDQPCDVVLVVEDGKKFKAHRKVLSEASLFFEKLLNSDMKESKEGVVRLEMFSESVMAATLEFIYTGHVQILAEDNARDLIVIADYLILQKLKTLAGGVLAQELNTSNCISTYYFSERYPCEELLSKTKKFILANFSAVYSANREDVLNMSSKEVEMWISSDEIEVSDEEDVFKIILSWIDHDKSRRKKYFSELFGRVRLIYVSRDFLISDVVTNDLVKDNEDCLHLVKDAIDFIDSKNYNYLTVPPRKSLVIPAIVMSGGADFVCYFPDEDSWYVLAEIPSGKNSFPSLPCKACECNGNITVSLNPYTNRWMRSLPLKNRCFMRIFGVDGDEIYALLLDERLLYPHTESLWQSEPTLFISKYKPESLSWEDIASVNHFNPYTRDSYCLVASDHFIYFIGGEQFLESEIEEWLSSCACCRKGEVMSDVDRYDLSNNQWDKVADIQVARIQASGAATNGKVFIAGGRGFKGNWLYSCEMYDEATNEWQFIRSLKKPGGFLLRSLLAADGKLYAVRCVIQRLSECYWEKVRVECYNPEENEWDIKTETALPTKSHSGGGSAGMMKLFKRLPNIRPLKTSTSDSPAFWSSDGVDLVPPGASSSHKTGRHDLPPLPPVESSESPPTPTGEEMPTTSVTKSASPSEFVVPDYSDLNIASGSSSPPPSLPAAVLQSTGIQLATPPQETAVAGQSLSEGVATKPKVKKKKKISNAASSLLSSMARKVSSLVQKWRSVKQQQQQQEPVLDNSEDDEEENDPFDK